MKPTYSLQCRNCGRFIPKIGVPRLNATCRNKDFEQCEFIVTEIESQKVTEPSLVKKAFSWCAAIGRWKKAGSPVRSQERANEILAICEACPLLVNKGQKDQRCGLCGCYIHRDLSHPSRSKLAMATEACPANPPLWTADV